MDKYDRRHYGTMTSLITTTTSAQRYVHTHSTAPRVRDFIADGGIVIYKCGVYTFARLQDSNRLSRMSVDNYEVVSMVRGYRVPFPSG